MVVSRALLVLFCVALPAAHAQLGDGTTTCSGTGASATYAEAIATDGNSRQTRTITSNGYASQLGAGLAL